MTVICISGTPATGKTSAAKALSEKLGWRLVKLNELAKEKNLYCGYDKKRDVNIVDIDLIGKEIKKIKGNLILDSHFSHEFDCDLVFVLRTNPKELRKRMKEKEWSYEKIEENVVAEIMEICVAEAMELRRRVIEINTTGKTAEAVANEMFNIVQDIFQFPAKRNSA